MILFIIPSELVSLVVQLLSPSSIFSLIRVSKFFNAHYRVSCDTSLDVPFDAISNGYNNLFKLMMPPIVLNKFSSVTEMYLLKKAIKSDNLVILNYLAYNGIFTLDNGTFTYAAKYGSIEMLEWMRKHKYPWNARTCCAAAEKGRTEVVKWLHQNGCPWDRYSCAAAAGNGHLELLKWLRTKFCDNGCSFDPFVFSCAARNGHFETLKWLHENGCPWDEHACSDAALNGHFEVLKWLHENGCPLSEHACCDAVFNGHFEVLKWLHENGCPWDKWTCYEAAKHGHLEILKYLHENGCPWGDRACMYAAIHGHLDILIYLRENRCPWNDWACMYAAKHGHFKIVRWFITNFNKYYFNEYVSSFAIEYGRLNILDDLYQKGCPIDGRSFAAAEKYPVILKWLTYHNCDQIVHVIANDAINDDVGMDDVD